MTARWPYEETSSPFLQSRALELPGGICALELPGFYEPFSHSSYELDDSFTRTAELRASIASTVQQPISISPRQRSSPELLHPISNESDRDSLWQRMCGVPAADRRHTNSNQYRKDWPLINDTQKAISSSSWASSKPDDGSHTESDARYETSTSPQSWLGSPVSGTALPPSEILSPISPMAKDVHLLSPMVSPSSVTGDNLATGMVEHHQGPAGGWNLLGSLPLQSTPKELNNSPSAATSREPYLPIPRPVSELVWPHHLTTNGSESESSTQSFHSAKSSNSEISSIIWPVMTQYDSLRADNPGFLPTAISPSQPLMSTCMASSSESETQIMSPLEPTRPATALHVSSFSRPSSQKSMVTEPAMQKMEMSDTHVWETKLEGTCKTTNCTFNRLDSMIIDDTSIESDRDIWTSEDLLQKNGKIQGQNKEIGQLEQADLGQYPAFPDIQLWRPLENPRATTSSQVHPTSAQSSLDDDRQHPATQYHSPGSVISETPSLKPQPHCFDHNALLVRNSESKYLQVEKLQELFHTVNSEWMQRIEPLPELWLRCKTLSVSGLFEKAVQTLKSVIHGRTFHTLEDSLAIVHLAFAAAFFLHRQHDYYPWDAFCDDTFLWQHAISSNEDRVHFLNAMTCWWSPKVEPATLTRSSRHTSFDSITAQGSFCFGNPKTLPDVLRNNEVFKLCIGFLDGKSIWSRSETDNHRSN